MTRLESAVRAVMAANKVSSLSDVAARIGIQKSNLSKILSGDVGLSPTNLRKLVTGISLDPAHQFEILSAHLYDEADRAGFALDLLRINLRGGKTADGPSFADLPTTVQRQLRRLADEIKNGDEGLAGALAWLTGVLDERTGKTYPETVPPVETLAAETTEGADPAAIKSLAATTTRALRGAQAARSAKATAPSG